jgi:hypothetical protein
MGVKTNGTSSLSGYRSVQHGKKPKKNPAKTCYLTNTNLTNTCKKTRGEVSFIFHASHITCCLSAKNVAIQFENVEKTNHCLRICQKTLHLWLLWIVHCLEVKNSKILFNRFFHFQMTIQELFWRGTMIT